MPRYVIVRLTPDEERRLFHRAKIGDEPAKNKLAESVAGLLASMAKNLSRKFPTVEFEEILAVGWRGVAAAYTYYDPTQGIRWITYAGTSARREMYRHATRIFSHQSRMPTTRREDLSTLSSPLPEPDPPATIDAVRDALSRLDSLSRSVVCAAYGIDRQRASVPVLSRELGLSPRRARHILSAAIESLALEPGLKPDGE